MRNPHLIFNGYESFLPLQAAEFVADSIGLSPARESLSLFSAAGNNIEESTALVLPVAVSQMCL